MIRQLYLRYSWESELRHYRLIYLLVKISADFEISFVGVVIQKTLLNYKTMCLEKFADQIIRHFVHLFFHPTLLTTNHQRFSLKACQNLLHTFGNVDYLYSLEMSFTNVCQNILVPCHHFEC